MELKIWVDGYQRLICGIGQLTTCQEVIYALAHATGKTGRFVLVEKWRTSERSLSPHDKPLELLLKWGEYASDVQFVLKCLGDTYLEKLNTKPAANPKKSLSPNFTLPCGNNDNGKVFALPPSTSLSFIEKSADKKQISSESAKNSESNSRQNQPMKFCSTGQITVQHNEGQAVDYAEIRRLNGKSANRPVGSDHPDTGDLSHQPNIFTSSTVYSIKRANCQLTNDYSNPQTKVDENIGNGPAETPASAVPQPTGLRYNRKPVPPSLASGSAVPKPPRSHIEAFFPLPARNETNWRNYCEKTRQPCQRSPGACRRAQPIVPVQNFAPNYETSTLPRLSRHYNMANALPRQFSSQISSATQTFDVPGYATAGPISSVQNCKKNSPNADLFQTSHQCPVRFEDPKLAPKILNTQNQNDPLKPQTGATPNRPPNRPPPPSYEEIMKHRRINNYVQIFPHQKTMEISQNCRSEADEIEAIRRNLHQSTDQNDSRSRSNQRVVTAQNMDVELICKIRSELNSAKLENSKKLAQIDSLTNKCENLDDEILVKSREVSRLNESLENEQKISSKKNENLTENYGFDSRNEDYEKLNEIINEKRKKLDELENKLCMKNHSFADFSKSANLTHLPIMGSIDFSENGKKFDASFTPAEQMVGKLTEIVKETTSGMWV